MDDRSRSNGVRWTVIVVVIAIAAVLWLGVILLVKRWWAS